MTGRAGTPGAVAPLELFDVSAIRIGHAQWEAIVGHARRKLEGDYLDGETAEQQAFGLLGGHVHGGAIETTGVFPLLRNLRHDPRIGSAVDATVHDLAT